MRRIEKTGNMVFTFWLGNEINLVKPFTVSTFSDAFRVLRILPHPLDKPGIHKLTYGDCDAVYVGLMLGRALHIRFKDHNAAHDSDN